MSKWAEEYFGSQLQTKEGTQSTSSVLNGKARVGIYFSAHWCPPCRGFTPVLAEFYEQLKEEDNSALEVVFVSSDQDDNQFAEYYGEMPWTAVPFANREAKQRLAEKFGVRGIPFFVILNGNDGSVLDTDARNTVAGARGVTSKALAKWAV